MKEIFYNWWGYNTEIFYFLNHLGNTRILPQILHFLSQLFNIENFVVYYFLLCGLSYCYVVRHYQARNDYREEFFRIYNSLVHIGICYAVFGLIYAALKFSINLPRPFCSLPSGTFETVINTASERCMSSFPSSHSGLALMVTVLAWRYLNGFARACAIIVTIMVAFSRIALSMHYPADIVYSYLIVLLVIKLAGIIFKLLEHNIIKYVGKWIKNLTR